MPQLKILILEDEKSDAELVKYHASTLEEFECEFRECYSEQTFLDVLADYSPDIILSDYKLNGYDGIRALHHCRVHLPLIPFIIVTGTLGEELAVQIIKDGANDFVLKENLSQIPQAMLKALREAEEVREKLNAEKRIKESEERYRALIEHLPNVVIQIDLEDRIQYINLSKGGFVAEKMLGSSIYNFIVPEFHEMIRKKHKAVIATQTVQSYESVSFDPAGKGRLYKTKVSPVIIEGKVTSLLLLTEDITERKAAERQIIEMNMNLERKVKERTEELSRSNEALRKEVVDRMRVSRNLADKNKEMMDSINYAKHIQNAFTRSMEKGKSLVNDFFVLDFPRDILSGDFHWSWHDSNHNCAYIVLGDCTGHGVPGSLMTILAVQLLEQQIKGKDEKREPKEVIMELDAAITDFLGQTNDESFLDDGIEMVLIRIDADQKKLHFTSIGRPLYYYRSKKMECYKGFKATVGGAIRVQTEGAEQHVITYESGDRLYVSSDGFEDQFGGSRGKKILRKGKENLLNEIQSKPFAQHGERIKIFFEEWKGDLDQVDDVSVLGIEL